MTAIRFTQDIPGEGLVEGDIIDVDPFSAASLIDQGKAEEYKPEEAAADAELDTVRYGGQDVRTIDDIVDPDVARNRRVMTATIVGASDPGPTTVEVSPDADPAEAPVPEPAAATVSPDPAAPATSDEALPTPPAAGPADVTEGNTKATRRGKTTTTDANASAEASAANAAGGDAGGDATP